MWGILLNTLLALVTIAYPVGYLLGEQKWLPIFPYVMAILWGLKALNQTQPKHYFSGVMALILTLVGVFKQTEAMYWYPVLINGLMLVLFGGSLWRSQSFVERLARLQTPDLPPQAVHYTRQVTKVWCGVFIFNIVISTVFVLLEQFDYWALYTGIVAYILMALVMAIEWLIRQHIQKRIQKQGNV